jgi:phenylalanyl-tRNA synthetase beta chain
MLISKNWLKEFIDFEMKPSEFEPAITMLGLEVESYIDYSKKFDKFIVAEVLEKVKHPNADKLSVCQVNTGKETLQVVCGAPNVEAGQKVILGLSGAVVPNGGFMLEKRVIRKIESNGMICSVTELELGEDHSGIWVLPSDSKVGMHVADFLNMNDTVYEIGITPNRADCLSHLGVAREISALLNKAYKKVENSYKTSSEKIEDIVEISIEDEDKCHRYCGMVIKNAEIKESPDWLKNKLNMLGFRPINNVVDITNLVLLEVGQPLHAFDLDKLAGKKIIVKSANEGEKFTTLDSKERILDNSMLMICDGDKSVAIGGVMGGENSEITTSTKDILLESAFFKPSSVRRTAKKLNIRSEASYRFERGIDIGNTKWAIERAATLMAELTGGEIAEGIIDIYPAKSEHLKIVLRESKVKSIIGVDINLDMITELLTRLQFRVYDRDDKEIFVEVPTHRVDIFEEIDLIEEVARLYNYDNIEPDYHSSTDISTDRIPENLSIPPMRRQLRNFLSNSGFMEIITQNMIDLNTSNLFTENPVKIANPLGEELSIMRSSLVPSIIKTIERNIRNGNEDIQLFEIGKSFSKIDSPDNFIKGINERENLIIAISGNNYPKQWGYKSKEVDFYDIKGISEELFEMLAIDGMKFIQSNENPFYYSPNCLEINVNGQTLGYCGEIAKTFSKRFDLEKNVYILEINLSKLYQFTQKPAKYSHVSSLPKSTRDLAFVVNADIQVNDILNLVRENGTELLKDLILFDIYQGKGIDPDKKSVAFSMIFSSNDRTLTDDEIEKIINNLIKLIETKFSAKLRA